MRRQHVQQLQRVQLLQGVPAPLLQPLLQLKAINKPRAVPAHTTHNRIM
jgi:hypothetical protein